MNILFVLPYCFVKPINKGGSTGFGIYTVKLAEALARLKDTNVYVMSLKQHLKSDVKINRVTYIGISDRRIIKKMFNIKSLKCAYGIIKYNYYNQSIIRKAINAFYSAGKSSYLDEIIKKYKIDFIHIHSAAQELFGIFYSGIIKPDNTLVTIHSSFVDEEKYGRYNQYFFNIVNYLLENKFNISLVSSGVKKDFIRKLNINDRITEQLHVVLNGTNMCVGNLHSQCKTQQKKILICIGTICDRKNQEFLLEALSILPEEFRSKFIVMFIGNDVTNGSFDEKVRKFCLENNIKKCGFINPEEMKKYYETADGNILLSKKEAFGLSVIEAYQFGVPTLTYADLDAADDFFSEDSAILMNDRGINTLTYGIAELLERKWDRQKIIEFGKNFELQHIANEYVEIYHDIKGN